MKTLFVFILIGLAVPVARADDKKTCGNVDMQSEFGNTRSQGSTGWCYAFSYADLIGHELGIKPPDMVSALDVAVAVVVIPNPGKLPKEAQPIANEINQHFKGQRIDERGGGDFEEVSDFYAERGRLCLESQIPSEGLVSPKGGIEALDGPLDRPKEDFISQRVDEFYMKRGFGKNTRLHLHPEEEDAGDDPQSPNNPISELCKPQPPFSFQDVEPRKSLNGHINDWAAAAIRDEHDKKCAKDPRLKKIEADIVYREGRTGTKQLQAAADKLLSRKKPFMIGYEPCNIMNTELGAPPNCMGHASSVVGRRWNAEKKTCEYLVRNSWGTDCSQYRKDIDCDRGNFWLSSKELFSSVRQIMSLRKTK